MCVSFPSLRYCCTLSVSANCRCDCSRSQLNPANTGENSNEAAGDGRDTDV